MNILRSLLIYNPIETFVIILSICLLLKIRLKRIVIIHSFTLGALTLMLQNIPNLVTNNVLFAILDILNALFVPILLFIYFNNIYKLRVPFKICFIIYLWGAIITTIYCIIFENIFSVSVYEFMSKSFISEFIVVVTLKSLMLGGVLLYEKYFKRLRNS